MVIGKTEYPSCRLIFTLNTNVKIKNIISHSLRDSNSEVISQLTEAFNHSLDIRNMAISLEVSVSNIVIGFKEIPIEPPIQLGKREFKIKNLTLAPSCQI